MRSSGEEIVPAVGSLEDLAGLAREAQGRQQRPQLASVGLGDVLRARGEPHVLAGLQGSHHDHVGPGLGGARAAQVVRRHPRTLTTPGGGAGTLG